MSKVKYRRKRHTKTSARSAPLPSFLPGMRGGADWHVTVPKEGETPHTLNQMGGHGEFVIPDDNSFESKHTRLHEMLHAAHSPLEGPMTIPNPLGSGILSGDSIMHAEELRIQLYTRSLVGADGMMHDRSDADLETYVRLIMMAENVEDLKQAFHWMMVIWPHREAWPTFPSATKVLLTAKAMHAPVDLPDPLVRKIRDLHGGFTQIIHQVLEMVKEDYAGMCTTGKIYPYHVTLQVAAYLEDVVGFIAQEHVDNNDGTKGDPRESALERITEELGGELEEDFEEIVKATVSENVPARPQSLSRSVMDRTKERTTKFKEHEEDHYDEVRWGAMSTRIAKMPLQIERFLNRRSRYKAAEQGAIPRYPHRAFTDGKVFSRRRKVAGGSVLIDDSGSMSLSKDAIDSIVKAAPAVKIGAYSGTSGKGELVVLAKDGKYADIRQHGVMPYGGNNLVDFPALEWLAKQPEPRIWVSDGWVVPTSGTPEAALTQCVKFCYEHRINRVDNPEDAHDVFIGKRSLIR